MPDNYDIGLPEFDVIDRIESSSGDYVYVLKLKDELKEQYKKEVHDITLLKAEYKAKIEQLVKQYTK